MSEFLTWLLYIGHHLLTSACVCARALTKNLHIILLVYSTRSRYKNEPTYLDFQEYICWSFNHRGCGYFCLRFCFHIMCVRCHRFRRLNQSNVSCHINDTRVFTLQTLARICKKATNITSQSTRLVLVQCLCSFRQSQPKPVRIENAEFWSSCAREYKYSSNFGLFLLSRSQLVDISTGTIRTILMSIEAVFVRTCADGGERRNGKCDMMLVPAMMDRRSRFTVSIIHTLTAENDVIVAPGLANAFHNVFGWNCLAHFVGGGDLMRLPFFPNENIMWFLMRFDAFCSCIIDLQIILRQTIIKTHNNNLRLQRCLS